MGYCANGSGDINFSRVLSDNEKEILESIVEDVFEYDIYEDQKTHHTTIDIWNSDNYYEDDVIEAFEKIGKQFPNDITEADINYNGEDGALWRFAWNGKEIIEQNGWVVFESEWIPDDKGIKCKNCQTHFAKTFDEYKFCPHCGGKCK